MSSEQNAPGQASGSVTIDASGRRHVRFDEVVGIADAVIIDPPVWDTLHARHPQMSDQQLLDLHHDDFAHGALEALKHRPAERPVVVNVYDVRLVRRPQ